jgi:hypothetical protein
LNGKIDSDTVNPLIEELKDARSTTIFINSPGGSTVEGQKLMSAIIKHGKVACIVTGRADSMAALVLESCQERVVTRGSTILFHPATNRAVSDMLLAYACGRMKLDSRSCLLFANDTLNFPAQNALDNGVVDMVVLQRKPPEENPFELQK